MKHRGRNKRIQRNEDNLRDLWDNVQCPSIQIISVPEEEYQRKEPEKIFKEIIVKKKKKSLKWGRKEPLKSKKIRVPNRINPKLNSPSHILITRMQIKHKEQILKEARKNSK